ncbi:MAG: TonB-dependent receptor [Akkermansiaceae bacterium]|nr:TonB-dependent receptor [Akkermansiaceae bacterium]
MKKNIAATALLTTVGGLAFSHAAPEPESQLDAKLEETTILANRSLTDLSKVGSSVTVFDASELKKSGIFHIDGALKFVPGVISESIAGQRGSASSALLRGTTTRYAQIRVDGIRVSGPNITTGNFFGGTNLNGLSRIEILRGPQSALYGGDAVGGVLGLYSEKGTGKPSGRLRIGGGSFDSFNTSLNLQGQLDKLSYALTLGYETTDNDLPNNRFEQSSYALRLDYQAHDSLKIGMTLRGFESDFRRPDYTDPAFARDADDKTTSVLATLFADLQVNHLWSSKLTLGLYDEKYDSLSFTTGASSITEGSKHALYWDNTIEWDEKNTTTTGIVSEHTRFKAFATSNKGDQFGIYLNHNIEVTDALTLNGGIRWEDYDTFGNETTWRIAATYNIANTGTTLKASAGKGFRPPTFLERYGGAFGFLPNPDIGPETSVGWDAGIEQKFRDGQYNVSATFFSNRIEDSIGGWPLSTNTPGTTVTEGIEVAASASWLDNRVHATLAYTYLDESIAGQPEHSGSLRVLANITDKLDAGFSVNYLDDRTFNGNALDAYTLVNLQASYEINPNVTLDIRVENLFDKNYELANFGPFFPATTPSVYPGRGRGIFGGVTISW